MKFSNRHFSFAITSIALAVVLISFNHCGLNAPKTNKKIKTIDENLTYDPDQDGMNEGGGDATIPTEEVVMQEVFYGVKSFEEIYMSMSVLTGVSPTAGNVDDVFRSVSVQLPTDNDIKSFSSVNQVSVTKLAAEYCHELVRNNNANRSSVWPNTNFNETSGTAFVGVKRDRIIDGAIKQFWQIADANMFEYNMERNEMSMLIDELLAGEANNSTTTQNVIKGVCTAILSSAHVTIL